MLNAKAIIDDDPYTMELPLCDDSGMVSDEQVPGTDFSYLARHRHLQGMTKRGQEYLKAHPEIGEKSWTCTGHAHLAGEHIRCTSPAHQSLPSTMSSPIFVGSHSPESLPYSDPNIHRCSECFQELFEADRGYGSTALACPTHDFNRQIITVPKWLEDEVRWHPTVALRYVAFVVDNMPV